VENGALPGATGWRVTGAAASRGPWTLTVTALCMASTQQAPQFTAPSSPRRAGCALACLPAGIARSDALTAGVPVLAVNRTRGATVAATIRTSHGSVVGRAVRRNAGKGPVKLPVRLGPTGRSALPARRQTHLRVRVSVTPRRGSGRSVVLPLTVRG
jgi:hypothetical protein